MTGPQVGDRAPDFELRDQHGQRVTLAGLRASRPVVLVFFPTAFSPVCSSELGTLRSAAPELARAGVSLASVSCDPMFTLRAFSDQEHIEFPMLTDFWPHGAVSSAYGVFDGDFGCSKRSTFVIDQDGAVRWLVHNAMPDPRSVGDYLEAVAQLDR